MPGPPVGGTLSAIERHDVLAGVSNFSNGVMNVTESRDVLSGIVAVGAAATMAKTESHDTFAGTGVQILGSMAAIARNDSFAAAGMLTSVGSMSRTEGHDTLAALGWAINGTLIATERHDSASMSGTCIVASMAATNRNDSFAGLGGFSSAPANLAGVSSSDVLVAAGAFKASGSMSATTGNDVASIAAMGGRVGMMSATEGHDVFAGTASLHGFGVLAGAGRNDIASMLSGSLMTGTMAVTERHDTMVGIGSMAQYNIYSNTGIGDPIDYTTPIATVATLTWTSGALAFPGTWKFGVRAFTVCGEEQNLDCSIILILDAAGIDITSMPPSPLGLRGIALAGGSVKLEWFLPPVRGPKSPVGFHCYYWVGGTPDYTTIRATVPYTAGFQGAFQTTFTGLTDGVQYTFAVRSYNATAEEKNTATIKVTADATAPAPPADFSGSLVSES